MDEDNIAVEQTVVDETKNHKKINGTVILAVFIAFVLLGYALFKNESYQNYNDRIPEKTGQDSSKNIVTTNDNAQPNETTNQKDYAETNMSALSAEEKAKQAPPPEKIEPYKINPPGGK